MDELPTDVKKTQWKDGSFYSLGSYEYKYKDKLLDLSDNLQLKNLCLGSSALIQQVKAPSSLVNLIISSNVTIEKSLNLSAAKRLTTLVVGSGSQLTDLKLPDSIVCLYINSRAQIHGKLDLSPCRQLKFLIIENEARLDNLILPPSLLNLSIASGVHINGLLDLSKCTKLEIFEAEPGLHLRNVLFPQQLRKITFGESSVVDAKLDLSGCNQLEHLVIGDYAKFSSGCQLPLALKTLIICPNVRIAGGLDVSRCRQLEELHIYYQNSALDLSNCKKLKELWISDRSPIGMNSLIALEKLRISGGSRLYLKEKLDLSRCVNLSSFVIEDGVVILEDVDLSACERLSSIKIDAIQVELQKDLILPESLTRLEIGSQVKIKGKIDTSRCKNLKDCKICSFTLKSWI
ncbi:MAG: hypothetical protein LBJ13_01495 [Puniceicoccales bacterium]|nr:hypothetical protein [Puniceicoccales bacterium]